MFPGGRSQHYHKMEEDYSFKDHSPVPCLPQSNYHQASHGYSGHGQDGYSAKFSERNFYDNGGRSDFSHHGVQHHSNPNKFSSTMSQNVEMSMGHGLHHGMSQMHNMGGGYRPNHCVEQSKGNLWQFRGADD